MSGVERRRRVVFHAELDSPGGCLACDFGHDTKPKVDTRRDPTRSDHITVLDDSCLLVRGADER